MMEGHDGGLQVVDQITWKNACIAGSIYTAKSTHSPLSTCTDKAVDTAAMLLNAVLWAVCQHTLGSIKAQVSVTSDWKRFRHGCSGNRTTEAGHKTRCSSSPQTSLCILAEAVLCHNRGEVLRSTGEADTDLEPAESCIREHSAAPNSDMQEPEQSPAKTTCSRSESLHRPEALESTHPQLSMSPARSRSLFRRSAPQARTAGLRPTLRRNSAPSTSGEAIACTTTALKERLTAAEVASSSCSETASESGSPSSVLDRNGHSFSLKGLFATPPGSVQGEPLQSTINLADLVAEALTDRHAQQDDATEEGCQASAATYADIFTFPHLPPQGIPLQLESSWSFTARPTAAQAASSHLQGSRSTASQQVNAQQLPAGGAQLQRQARPAAQQEITVGGQAVVQLAWSPAMSRVLMTNACELEQVGAVAHLALTTILKSLPEMKHLLRDIGSSNRLAYVSQARLRARQRVTAQLIEETQALLAALHQLSVLQGGPNGSLLARRMESGMRSLEAGLLEFEDICDGARKSEKFFLVNQTVMARYEAQCAAQGSADTHRAEVALRSVEASQQQLKHISSCLGALHRIKLASANEAILFRRTSRKTQVQPPAPELAGSSASLPQTAPGSRMSSFTCTGLAPPDLLSVDMRPCLKSSPTPEIQDCPWPSAMSCTSRPGSSISTLAHRTISDLAEQQSITASVSGRSASTSSRSKVPQRLPQLAPHQQYHCQPSAGHSEFQVKAQGDDVYVGFMVDGLKCKTGAYNFSNGDIYAGQFKADVMEGYGVYTFNGKGRYEGQWAQGVYAGYGSETFAKGSTYHGFYRGGLRDGTGVCRYFNGDYYEGMWADGVRQGRGMQQCTDGSNYVGDYILGKRDGYGCYTFANGDRYIGEYEADMPHGHGMYVFESGQVYEGQWMRGRKHGWCIYALETGEQWAGKWEEGQPVWVEGLEELQAQLAEGPADAQTEVAARLQAVQHAAQEARDAGQVGASRLSDHWLPAADMQAMVKQVVQRANAATRQAQAYAKQAAQMASRQSTKPRKHRPSAAELRSYQPCS